MVSEVASGSLILALVSCLVGIGAAVISVRRNLLAWAESARVSLLVQFGLVTFALLLTSAQFLFGFLHVRIVYESTRLGMTPLERLAAITSQSEGAMLVFVWFIGLAGLMLALLNWSGERQQQPGVTAVYLGIQAVFLGILVFVESPYLRMWQEQEGNLLLAVSQPGGCLLFCPTAGKGMLPLDFSWLAWAQRPLLFFSTGLMTAGFAIAAAAMITGKLSTSDLARAHPIFFSAWMVLGAAIVIDVIRNYARNPVGGFWTWDKEQTAALVSLLLLSALLHGLSAHRNRGLFRHSILFLIVLTYLALMVVAINAIFDGSADDLQSGKPWLQIFWAAAALMAGVGLVLRWRYLKSEERIESVVSREALTGMGIILLSGLAAIGVWGLAAPLLAERLFGSQLVFDMAQYRQAMAPPILFILFLLALAPSSAWRFSTVRTLAHGIWKPLLISLLAVGLWILLGVLYRPALIVLWLVGFGIISNLMNFWRKARAIARLQQVSYPQALALMLGKNAYRYGGHIIHMGVLVTMIGIIGVQVLAVESQGRVRQGESLRLAGYEFIFRGATTQMLESDHQAVTAEVEIRRQGKQSSVTVYPRIDYYTGRPTQTTFGQSTSLAGDAFVSLADWLPATAESAVLQVYFSPLVPWAWIGLLLIMAGGMYQLARWPKTHLPSLRLTAERREGGVNGQQPEAED
ncbi:MAG: hypothetical protein GYA48_07820 [Chloroflexi bacterium]|nr:hypothetical protein [Chloroflexota bacterium]